MGGKLDIWVYAHWLNIDKPKCIGVFSAQQGKGRIAYSFSYDDHLRNHGFLLGEDGWRLSPAYDINPYIDKNGLALNTDMDDNSLDLELAQRVGMYFRLTDKRMSEIIEEVRDSVSNWQKEADEIGISRNDQLLMKGAFRC